MPPLRFLLLACLLLSSCGGYQWVAVDGVAGPGTGVSRLTVPVVINESAEPLLSERITAVLRARLIIAGVTVTNGGDPTLTARVVSFDDEVLAFDVGGGATLRRVVLTLSLTVKDGSKVIWSNPAWIGSAEYGVTGDPTQNRDGKDRAVADAVFSLVQRLVLVLGSGA